MLVSVFWETEDFTFVIKTATETPLTVKYGNKQTDDELLQKHHLAVVIFSEQLRFQINNFEFIQTHVDETFFDAV